MSNYRKMCHQSAMCQQIDRCSAGGKTKNIRKGVTKSLRDETLAQAILLRQSRGKKIIYSFFMRFHPSSIPSLQHLPDVCPSEEWFPGTTAPPFFSCWDLSHENKVVPQGKRGEAGSFPKGVSMVRAVRNKKAWGRQWVLWVAACEVVGPGTSGYQYTAVFGKKTRLGFQTTAQKKGGRLEI